MKQISAKFALICQSTKSVSFMELLRETSEIRHPESIISVKSGE